MSKSLRGVVGVALFALLLAGCAGSDSNSGTPWHFQNRSTYRIDVGSNEGTPFIDFSFIPGEDNTIHTPGTRISFWYSPGGLVDGEWLSDNKTFRFFND